MDPLKERRAARGTVAAPVATRPEVEPRARTEVDAEADTGAPRGGVAPTLPVAKTVVPTEVEALPTERPVPVRGATKVPKVVHVDPPEGQADRAALAVHRAP